MTKKDQASNDMSHIISGNDNFIRERFKYIWQVALKNECLIDSFDRFVIVMIDSDRKRNMIYKHAISTIILD